MKTSMKTYWDLSEKERAALSREDVERYVDAELMMKGVLKVEPPKECAIPDPPTVSRRNYHRGRHQSRYGTATTDVAFADAAAAQTLLSAVVIEDDYETGLKVARTIFDLDEVTAVPEDEYVRHRSALQAHKSAIEANKKAREEFAAAAKKQDDALSGLWADWHECRQRDARLRKVIETFEDYKRIAGGDVAVAARFLRKPFTEEEIAEAAEWFGVPVAAE